MRSSLFVFAGLGVLAVSGAYAAPPKSNQGLGSIGTQQMPGAICKFGQAYTLGKPATSAWNVNLTSAEYLATRVKLGKRFVWPKAGNKFIVVHFTLHNPLPKEQRYDKTVKFTAVMPDMKNCESSESYAEQAPNELIFQSFKPAQKMAAYCVIEVPAGEVDKLILANRADATALVARYPLAGLVKKIAPPYADPSDPTGSTPLKVVKMGMNQPCQIENQDVAVTKVEVVEGPSGSLGRLGKNQVYVLVTYQVTCRNEIDGWLNVGPGSWFTNKLIDADGGSSNGISYCLRTGVAESTSFRVNFGESVSFRKAYTVSKGIKLGYVTLLANTREARFDLGGFEVK